MKEITMQQHFQLVKDGKLKKNINTIQIDCLEFILDGKTE